MNGQILSNREISRICRSLSLLLHAGISMGDGLFLLAEEEDSGQRDGSRRDGSRRDGAERELFLQMGQQVDDGRSLAQAMEESGRFPVYVTGLVKVGECTGHLEEALLVLSGYYDEQERMAHQVKTALLYPAMLLLLMLLIIGVLLVKVLPVFDDVYASLGGGLTGLAGGLLQVGQFLEALLPVLCVILTIAAVGVLLYSVNDDFRRHTADWCQKCLGDKGVFRRIHDAHFAQALAMGLGSGMQAEEAVGLAGEILRGVPGAEERCQACMEGLERGENLSAVLRNSQVLPASYCRMLELGVRGGNGDQVMGEIADRLSKEASQALEQNVAMVEPVMVMTASLLVGVILLSVMLPLMNIMSAIG